MIIILNYLPLISLGRWICEWSQSAGVTLTHQVDNLEMDIETSLIYYASCLDQ